MSRRATLLTTALLGCTLAWPLMPEADTKTCPWYRLHTPEAVPPGCSPAQPAEPLPPKAGPAVRPLPSVPPVPTTSTPLDRCNGYATFAYTRAMDRNRGVVFEDALIAALAWDERYAVPAYISHNHDIILRYIYNNPGMPADRAAGYVGDWCINGENAAAAGQPTRY